MKNNLQLYIVFLALVLTVTSAYILNGKGVVLPNDPYVYIGKELVLMCNLTQPVPEDSSSLYFTRKVNQIIPRSYIRVLSTRSIQLRIVITGPEDEGSYVCKLNRSSGKTEVIGSQYVRVEHEPKAVNDINCEVYNWQNMTCKWDLGVEYVHPELMSVTLVWTVDNEGQYDCLHPTPTSCEWRELEENGIGSFKPDMLYYMILLIKNTKTGQEKRSNYFRIYTDKIVRPASVTEVITRHNSTCMDIKWSHPDKYHGKIYRLQYTSQWDQPNAWKNISLNDQESYTLCNLTPHTLYTVKIASKPLYEGFWSDSVAQMVMMKEGVPGDAPVILPGSYIEKQEAKGYYKVLLYWKPIDKMIAHGKITSYKMTCVNLDTGKSDVSFVGNDFKSGWLLLMDKYTYEIRLQGETKAGVSPHTSSIVLPAREKRPGYPRDLLVDHLHVIGQDKRVLNVQWRPGTIPDDEVTGTITGYTVYWCKGPQSIQQCREPLSWKKVSAEVTEVNIEVDIDVQLIGVSMETKFRSGTVSSGIVWNSCIYRKNSKPTAPPRNFHLITDQLTRSITVEWDRFECHENHGYIQQYLISICQVVKGSNCTDPPKVLSVGGHIQSYVITDLNPEMGYRVWMQAVSEGGAGPSSQPIYTSIHVYGLQAEEIGGIAVAIILVVTLAIVGVIFCVRRMVGVVKDWNKEYPIVLPNLPLPQRPMPELPQTPWRTSDSDSDGIYEKIHEHNDSSTPSTPESSLNVPLINNNNNYGSKNSSSLSKSHLYGDNQKRKIYGKTDCSDSGRSSMVSNTESLWSRLNPQRVNMDSKHYGYGKNGNMSTFGPRHKQRRPPNCRRKLPQKTNSTDENISPYSCVDIVNCENSDVVKTITALGKNLLNCNPSSTTENGKLDYVGSSECGDTIYTEDNNLVHSVGSMHSDPAYSDQKGMQSIISTHSDPTYSLSKDVQKATTSLSPSNRHILEHNNSIDSEYLYPKNNLSRTPSKNTSSTLKTPENEVADMSQHFNIQPNMGAHKNSFKGVVDKSGVNEKNTALSLDDLLDSTGGRKKISSDLFDNCVRCEDKNSAVSMDQLDSVPFDLGHRLRKNLNESVNSDDRNLSSSVEDPIYDESWDKSCSFAIPGTSYCRVEDSGDFNMLDPRFRCIPQDNPVKTSSNLTDNGYLKHTHMNNSEDTGSAENSNSSTEKRTLQRPVSIVRNLPPNFYASLSALENGMATEL